jgi:hypothetical protein
MIAIIVSTHGAQTQRKRTATVMSRSDVAFNVQWKGSDGGTDESL